MPRTSRAFGVTVATVAVFVVLAVVSLGPSFAQAASANPGLGAPQSVSTLSPGGSTAQILALVRGVAADAGAAYTRGNSTPAVAGPAPVGGVQTGLGGTVRSSLWFRSPAVVLSTVLAAVSLFAAAATERRRRANR
jgi:hypothetical protein